MPSTEAGADVVVITGVNGRFGGVIARTLAAAGYRVFAGMRDISGRNLAAADELRAWARTDGLFLEVVELDVTSESSVAGAIEQVTTLAGRVDIVVNNAGIASLGPLEAFSLEQVQAIFDTNVFGPLRLDKAVLPGMRARGSGLLIHISSALGRVLPGIGGPYSASKWALEGLAEGLGNQIAVFGIDVVLIEPGSYPSEALAKGAVPADQEVFADYARIGNVPQPPQYGDPPPDIQEVADATLAVIEAAPGSRPTRVVVGTVMTGGVAEYNARYDELKQAMIAARRTSA
jgi:NAD(P)-dependent dehydrogenase (short-subunit alcohol dehydrogenase family)